jgi:hypothetical protein
LKGNHKLKSEEEFWDELYKWVRLLLSGWKVWHS